MNFVPTRPIEDIAQEYIETFWTLYEPKKYLDRADRCFLKLDTLQHQAFASMPTLVDLRALTIVIWRQGFKRDTRWKFWHHLFNIIRHNPGVWEHYLTMCAHNEHFL